MRLVSVSKLKPDMVLARSIYYRDCLILKEGQTELYRYANRLKNIGIEYVYVEDAFSEGIEVSDAIREGTRVACKRLLRNAIENFSNNSTLDMSELSQGINNIVDDILKITDVQVSLSDICSADDYTFSHSVSATVYSLLIGKKMGYNKAMLEKLATGTLLHDIGKVMIDKRILCKQGKLNKEEFEYIKKHTLLEYEALKKCRQITELSRVIALHHHERMDATGYPYGLPAGELHEFSRIVAVADVYDALTSNRCYRNKWTTVGAVNHLIECSDTKLDTNLVAALIQQIAIYPNGSMVHLSNNYIGIVREQNRSMPFRPIVRVIADDLGHEVKMFEIDLMKELSITILETEIERSEKWSLFDF